MSGVPETFATSFFADLVGLTTRRIQQLISEGILPNAGHGKLPAKTAMKAFIDWRVKGETRAPVSDDPLENERTRKLKLENDEKQRLLVRVDDAVAAVDAVLGPLPSELAGIAPRVTDDLVLRRKIKDEINAVCGEVSKRVRKAGADLRAGRDALAAGAQDDAERVGGEEELSA